MKINKNEAEVTKKMPYILQFIDSVRFLASSLSNLVNNISERIHWIKCKFGYDDKKCETCGFKYKYTTLFWNTQFSKII